MEIYLRRGSESTASHNPQLHLEKWLCRHKDAGEKKEEHTHPEEVPLSGKDETQTLLHKIEELEKENKESRKNLEDSKVETRVPGLDTLAEAVDKMREETTPDFVCLACANILEIVGYKVCATSNISIGTQTELWEADTQAPVNDDIVTKELAVETKHPAVINLEAIIQEPTNDTVVP